MIYNADKKRQKMNHYHVLYNPYANSGKGKEKAMKLSDILDRNSVSYYDVTEIEDMNSFVTDLDSNENHTVSVVDMYNVSKIRALCVLPSMFKGKHIKHTDIIDVCEGHEITVIYDKPAPMQIDGETILDVIRCDVRAGKP